jgi:hypothetical protein
MAVPLMAFDTCSWAAARVGFMQKAARQMTAHINNDTKRALFIPFDSIVRLLKRSPFSQVSYG